MNDSTITRRILKLFGVTGYLLGAIGRATTTIHLYNELQAMDDGELAALGLSRDRIGRYVAESIEPATFDSAIATAAADVRSAANDRTGVEGASTSRRAA